MTVKIPWTRFHYLNIHNIIYTYLVSALNTYSCELHYQWCDKERDKSLY